MRREKEDPQGQGKVGVKENSGARVKEKREEGNGKVRGKGKVGVRGSCWVRFRTEGGVRGEGEGEERRVEVRCQGRFRVWGSGEIKIGKERKGIGSRVGGQRGIGIGEVRD